MAMHSSEDLAATITVFFNELKLLGVNQIRCGVGLVDEASHIGHLTTTITTEQGESKQVSGDLLLANHPVLAGIYDNWRLQQEYHPVLKGAEIKNYYEVVSPQIIVGDFHEDEIQYGYFFFFKEGAVYSWSFT